PVTANGKIDRKKLPSMSDAGRQVEQGYVGARTPVEEITVGIFEEVLKVDQVGIHDNFFELGGHSLLATQVVSRVRNAFGVEIGVRSIFRNATVESLARTIEEEVRGGEKDLEMRLAYWKKQFSESLPTLSLPADYPSPPASAHNMETKSFLLPGDLYQSLKAL